MERNEQITLLRYWAAQASNAVDDIAFILAFEKVRAEWAKADEDDKRERFVPEIDPVSSVALRRRLGADTTLFLFVSKATDTNGKTARLSALKNAILECNFERPELKDKIIETFRRTRLKQNPLLQIRNKVIAHIDLKELLHANTEVYTRRQLIADAREIIGLVRCLLDNAPVVLDNSGRHLRESDNTLLIRYEKFATMAAEEFWQAIVQRWYKE